MSLILCSSIVVNDLVVALSSVKSWSFEDKESIVERWAAGLFLLMDPVS